MALVIIVAERERNFLTKVKQETLKVIATIKYFYLFELIKEQLFAKDFGNKTDKLGFEKIIVVFDSTFAFKRQQL